MNESLNVAQALKWVLGWFAGIIVLYLIGGLVRLIFSRTR